MEDKELYTQNILRNIEKMREIVLALVEENKECTFTLLRDYLTCLTAHIAIDVLNLENDRFAKSQDNKKGKGNRKRLPDKNILCEDDDDIPDTEGIQ